MHKMLFALALAAGSLSGPAAFAQTAPAASAQGNIRMPTQVALGERVVREVMFTPNGGSVILMYDMPAGAPQSRRVVRLENVNGMLEVIYDSAMTNMPLATGGTPRLTQQGGSYMVEYGPR